jgi:hypothetical protein
MLAMTKAPSMATTAEIIHVVPLWPMFITGVTLPSMNTFHRLGVMLDGWSSSLLNQDNDDAAAATAGVCLLPPPPFCQSVLRDFCIERRCFIVGTRARICFANLSCRQVAQTVCVQACIARPIGWCPDVCNPRQKATRWQRWQQWW